MVSFTIRPVCDRTTVFVIDDADGNDHVICVGAPAAFFTMLDNDDPLPAFPVPEG